MYESFFQLRERPFGSMPTAARYYPAAAVEDARKRLTRIVRRGQGPGLLIGPPGTGKSLLCEVLAGEFDQELAVVRLACGQFCTRRALLQAILYGLRLPYRERDEGELRLSLIDRLTSEDEVSQQAILLLVDEAHALPIRLLEEIRMISNLARAGKPQVRLVLAGLPVLEERFASPKLECFNQRVAARCYLHALDRNDTRQYVRAQIESTGGDPSAMVDDEALEAVYRASGGVPRLINQLCDHAFMMACAGGVKRLGPSGIEEAWSDLQQLPLPLGVGKSPEPAAQNVIEFGALDEDGGNAETASAPGAAANPAPPAEPARSGRPHDPMAQLEDITTQLASIDPVTDIEPTAASAAELEFVVGQDVVDPLDDSFAEEEIIVDRYAAYDGASAPPTQGVAELPAYMPPALPRTSMARTGDPSEPSASWKKAKTVSGQGAARNATAGSSGGHDPVLPEQSARTTPPPDARATATREPEAGAPTPGHTCGDAPPPGIAGAARDPDRAAGDGPSDDGRPSPGGEDRYRLLFSQLRHR